MKIRNAVNKVGLVGGLTLVSASAFAEGETTGMDYSGLLDQIGTGGQMVVAVGLAIAGVAIAKRMLNFAIGR